MYLNKYYSSFDEYTFLEQLHCINLIKEEFDYILRVDHLKNSFHIGLIDKSSLNFLMILICVIEKDLIFKDLQNHFIAMNYN